MDEVFLVSRAGALAGFGGVRVFHPEWQGRRHCLIATGRVCLTPELRGRNVIHQVGLRYYLRERRAHPRWPIYWLFAASSYRSYLVMARNFREYWPRPNATLPERERALLASVADLLDPPSGDPARADHPYSDLVYRDGDVAIDPEALRDPDVAYYASINPDPAHGGFVVALAPLTVSNWATAFSRAVTRSLQRALSGEQGRRVATTGRPGRSSRPPQGHGASPPGAGAAAEELVVPPMETSP